MIRKNGRTARRLRKLARPFYSPDYADNLGVLLPLKHPLITPGIAREIYFGDYEKKEATIVSRRLEANDVVMEVGAGIGFLSAFCAKQIGSDRVFAYDANPALAEVVAQTYAANNVHPAFRTAMLGKGAGKTRFFVEQEFWASSANHDSGKAQAIEVDQIDLNEEIARIRPTFMIVDIEGGEGDLFALADLSSVSKICVETHASVIGNDGITNMLTTLFQQGFCLDLGVIQKYVLYLYRLQGNRAP
ncbi:MAG: FkbM family methyltransferase [Rhodocyclaceae bacterium]|nr:FkbM family methyltransferase [Rhodocyclaceae bacterium]MDZ4215945.1 FkbM family methyltransferase [Rhodocyclaceae bacterium]